MSEQVEIVDVPNGSILKSYPDGTPYWLTPEGEELLFDLEGLIEDHNG